MSRLDDVKPVGYADELIDGATIYFDRVADSNIPLYTRDQLMPKVKFDKEDMEHWDNLYHDFSGKKFRLILENLEKEWYYSDFYKRFTWSAETVAVLANLFSEYDPEHPEETIEIIKDKKWFVVSDAESVLGYIAFVAGIEGTVPVYGCEPKSTVADVAYRFDTE
ncbi:hypothetical protein KII97_02445 [Leuconostoc gelidum subsp. gasicomitatum]|uniref:hypothetical protein n=1 Tax=Leuconostoc gasicomitatum TaxID=115778 RepID=UPI001CC43B72|nr:hypothetical protein [Leuconostoc gasicomitatum]MBZ5995367.1 hypothetical protein [Leuconostoc gasicomitatum]